MTEAFYAIHFLAIPLVCYILLLLVCGQVASINTFISQPPLVQRSFPFLVHKYFRELKTSLN